MASTAGRSDAVLTAEGIGKRYERGESRFRRLGRYLRGDTFAGDDDSVFWAVRDVSFRLERSASLGVIGRNGAGKSTLLRILAGTAHPTEGRVDVAARLACLLDLGIGFDGNETGRQNAQTSLVLQAGLTTQEARAQMPEIEAFAEIGEFFDRPIRTYSDGMRLRLAFATITLLDPEVLVTDEILVVGDEEFQHKCREWFESFLARGGSLVLCAHDLSTVQRLCSRTMWLEAGRIAEVGDSRSVIRHYREAIGATEEGAGTRGTSHGVGEIAGLPFEVVDLHLRDCSGTETRELAAGATVDVEVDILAPGGTPHVHVSVTRDDLVPVYGVSSDMDGATAKPLGEGRWRFGLRFVDLPLTAGDYRLRAHALDESATRLYDTVELSFSVAGDDTDPGLVRLSAQWHSDPT